nr:M20 family metallopeptidase [Candidatus Njordarchaeum guaymaensis]
MSDWRGIGSEIKEDEVISLLREIVRVPSHIGVKDGERKVAQILASHFRTNGIESQIEAVGAGANIFARVGTAGEGVPSIMFNGHLDTVPVGNMSVPPLEALVKGGVLYGRGACDMKGGVAAMACALVALKRSGVKLKGTLIFAGVSGEESGSPGTRRIVQRGPKADCAIVGEPTELKIAPTSKGMAIVRVTVRGITAHGSAPHEGVNSIQKATKIVSKMNEEFPRLYDAKAHHLLGPPTLNIGVIRAGTQPNIVPDQCVMMIDRRTLPRETPDDLKAEFESVIASAKKDDSKVDADVNIDGIVLPAMDTPPDAPFVRCLREAVDEIYCKAEFIGLSGSTDGALLSTGGVPSVVLGPGEMNKAHSAEECVNLEEVIKATKIYAYTALRYLS